MLIVVFFTSCSKENKIDSNLLVFHATPFKSESFEVEVPVFTGYGGDETTTETRYKVIHFKEGGKLDFFTVDAKNKIIAGVVSHGTYKLDYPNITNITLASEQSSTVVSRPQSGSGMTFTLDGLTFIQSSENFTQ